jgi:hypothetical protein
MLRKTCRFGMRLTPELRAAAESAALDENRSITNWIERLIVQHLRQGQPSPERAAPRVADDLGG